MFDILIRRKAQATNLERWSSGLRHTLGKRARLTASAGSNPVLSATLSLNRTLGLGSFDFQTMYKAFTMEAKRKQVMKMYKYIDLFAGIGGLSLGFDRAGFTNLFSVEYDKVFAENYSLNLKNHKMICKDIREISDEDIKMLVGNNIVDIIIGGPPCQGFSIAGNIGRTFLDDPRNYLFKEFVRFVQIARPKMFLLENVAAMETHNNGRTIEAIKNAFREIGYEIKNKVLNSKYYNVPQERRRIFLVGMEGSNIFEFPAENATLVSVEQAIGDLPILASGESSNIPNHIAMKHSQQMLEKMKYVKDGGNRYDIPPDLRPQSGDARKYIRYSSKKPSVCITGDMRKVFHYSQNRALTNRELARIQTFPDDFTFVGNNGKIQQAIGNAVPPNLAYLLALKIREVLDGEISKD